LYNFRKNNKLPNKFNDYIIDIPNLEEDIFELNDNNNNDDDLIVNNYIKLKDYKLPPLHKKYFRPYFSPKYNSWEMDFMVIPYIGKKSPFKNKNLIEANEKYFYYLFVININTRYLCVFPSFFKDSKIIINSLNNMINNGFEINNIRGDKDSAFQNNLIKWLNENSITHYFTPNIYTNRNRIVDRVMRTIRDKFDQLGINKSLLDVNLMKKIVNNYNHTTHAAFEYKFTPAQVQFNKELETIYTLEKMDKLENIDQSYLKFYKPGDLLLIHIPYKNINYKRRRNFSHLASFIRYDYGNVMCKPIYPTESTPIVIPIYYTKFINNNINDINNEIKNYFNI
jgi:hypothetical protein